MKKINDGFPKDFLFAAGFAAPQYEGGFGLDGKGVSVPDCALMIDQSNRKNHIQFTKEQVLEAAASTDNYRYAKRRGIDFYHTYKEDLKLFGEMGLRALRLSMAWTRIYPQGDETQPNEKGLKFYSDVLNHTIKNGMKPIVTICHYDMPINLVLKYGGWKNRKLIDFYVHYATTLLDNYHDQVKYWICFNQINLLHFEGFASVGLFKESPTYEQDCYQALHNQMVACAKVHAYARKHYPEVQIGTMVSDAMFLPLTPKPEDVCLAMDRRNVQLYCVDVQCRGEYSGPIIRYMKDHNISIKITKTDERILKKDTMDFLAVSYYTSKCINSETDGMNPAKSTSNPYDELTPWGWGTDSKTMYRTISEYYHKYQKPILIAESGVGLLEELNEDGTVHDTIRINYYRDAIKSLKKALENGVEIIAYCAWSPIDIVSSGSGEMSKRYGMIYVDQDDFGGGSKKRYPKDSYYWYKKVIASNGENLE